MSIDEALLYRVLREAVTIAVVGCSADPLKPGFFVPQYLAGQRYRVLPVNPNRDSILGERCHDSLLDIGAHVDVVEVFRPRSEVADLARQAAAIRARCLWLQLGIEDADAARIARTAGLVAVMDECMGVAHGRLGLGPGVQPPVPSPG